MKIQDIQFLGQITKSHGVKGQLILKSGDTIPESLQAGESLFVEIDGLMVPFFIKNIISKDEFTRIIQLDDIDSAEQANELQNKRVFVNQTMINKVFYKTKEKNHMIGFKVIDKHEGEIGILDEIVDYTKNPLLKVISGNKEMLIPFTKEIAYKIDKKEKKIFVNLPDGLMEL